MSSDYEARGAAAELFRCHDTEILIEGPAGTGKSRAVLERLHFLAESFPGSRFLLARKSKARMAQSILTEFETSVLPVGHELLQNSVSRPQRESYLYSNGSEMVVSGFDDATRIMSTQYDVIAAFEATELTLDDYERALSRLRNNVLPFQQAICDCNPGAENHWLNRRAASGRMTRLLSRFPDNPSITPEYLKVLSNLTGVRRERLYEGKWVSAEGQIWECFGPVHVINAELQKDEGGWYLTRGGQEIARITYTIAAIDWGYRAAGALLVIGVDADNVVYVLHEVYQTRRDIDWWAAKAESLRRKFNILRFACDPSRPESIETFNRRLGRSGGYHLASEVDIAGGATNAIQPGLSAVRERLENRTLFFLADCLESRDEALDEAKKPCGILEEIPSYSYRMNKDGQQTSEGPTLDADDHSADALRYGIMQLDRADWRAPPPEKNVVREGSFAAVLGHAAVWEAMEDEEFHL